MAAAAFAFDKKEKRRMGGEGLSGVRVRENNTGCGSTPRVFSG